MPEPARTKLALVGVTVVAKALLQAERQLRLYDNAKVLLDGGSRYLGHASQLDAIKRARQALGVPMTHDEQKDVVGALEQASIAMAIAGGAPVLGNGPAGRLEVDFGDTPEQLSLALNLMGLDRRYPRPGRWQYVDPAGGEPRPVKVREAHGQLVAVFAGGGDIEVPAGELPGDFQPMP